MIIAIKYRYLLVALLVKLVISIGILMYITSYNLTDLSILDTTAFIGSWIYWTQGIDLFSDFDYKRSIFAPGLLLAPFIPFSYGLGIWLFNIICVLMLIVSMYLLAIYIGLTPKRAFIATTLSSIITPWSVLWGSTVLAQSLALLTILLISSRSKYKQHIGYALSLCIPLISMPSALSTYIIILLLLKTNKQRIYVTASYIVGLNIFLLLSGAGREWAPITQNIHFLVMYYMLLVLIFSTFILKPINKQYKILSAIILTVCIHTLSPIVSTFFPLDTSITKLTQLILFIAPIIALHPNTYKVGSITILLLCALFATQEYFKVPVEKQIIDCNRYHVNEILKGNVLQYNNYSATAIARVLTMDKSIQAVGRNMYFMYDDQYIQYETESSRRCLD